MSKKDHTKRLLEQSLNESRHSPYAKRRLRANTFSNIDTEDGATSATPTPSTATPLRRSDRLKSISNLKKQSEKIGNKLNQIEIVSKNESVPKSNKLPVQNLFGTPSQSSQKENQAIDQDLSELFRENTEEVTEPQLDLNNTIRDINLNEDELDLNAAFSKPSTSGNIINQENSISAQQTDPEQNSNEATPRDSISNTTIERNLALVKYVPTPYSILARIELESETPAHLLPFHGNNFTSFEEERFRTMTVPIENYIAIVPEYDGSINDLNAYIKIIDRLWNRTALHTLDQRQQLALAIQSKLKGKASIAIADLADDTWPEIKKLLKQNIRPQNNPDVASLQLLKTHQDPKESLDDFIKKIKELLSVLNLSYDPQLDDATKAFISSENNKKARKALEDGIFNKKLQNRLITANLNTFEQAVEYAKTQEIRINEHRPFTDMPIQCNYCQISGHRAKECRKRIREAQDRIGYSPNRKVVCSRCKRPNHLANECYANLSIPRFPPRTYYNTNWHNGQLYSNQNYSHNYSNANHGNYNRQNWQNNYSNNYNRPQNPNHSKHYSNDHSNNRPTNQGNNNQNNNQNNGNNNYNNNYNNYRRPNNSQQRNSSYDNPGQFRQINEMPLYQAQAQIHSIPQSNSGN